MEALQHIASDARTAVLAAMNPQTQQCTQRNGTGPGIILSAYRSYKVDGDLEEFADTLNRYYRFVPGGAGGGGSVAVIDSPAGLFRDSSAGRNSGGGAAKPYTADISTPPFGQNVAPGDVPSPSASIGCRSSGGLNLDVRLAQKPLETHLGSVERLSSPVSGSSTLAITGVTLPNSDGPISPRHAQQLVEEACALPLSHGALRDADLTKQQLLDMVQVGPLMPAVEAAFKVFCTDNHPSAGAELIDTMSRVRPAIRRASSPAGK